MRELQARSLQLKPPNAQLENYATRGATRAVCRFPAQWEIDTLWPVRGVGFGVWCRGGTRSGRRGAAGRSGEAGTTTAVAKGLPVEMDGSAAGCNWRGLAVLRWDEAAAVGLLAHTFLARARGRRRARLTDRKTSQTGTASDATREGAPELSGPSPENTRNFEAKRGRSPAWQCRQSREEAKKEYYGKIRERMRSGLQPTRATNRHKPQAGDSPLRSALELEREGGSANDKRQQPGSSQGCPGRGHAIPGCCGLGGGDCGHQPAGLFEAWACRPARLALLDRRYVRVSDTVCTVILYRQAWQPRARPA
jgi:predicted DNA-binding WGR domain protein